LIASISQAHSLLRIQPTTPPTTPPTTTIPTTTAPPVRKCPGDWNDYGDMGCYKFVHDSNSRSWLESVGYCESIGGYLAEPKTQSLAAFLGSLAGLASDFSGNHHWYIGLTDFGHEGNWIWQWSDEPLTFSSWGPGSPNVEAGNVADCGLLVVDQGQSWWKDTDCLQVTPDAAPICQFDPTSEVTTPSITTSRTTTTTAQGTTTTTPGNPTACPSEWTYRDGTCYKLYTKTKSWTEAEQFCKSQNSHLASVHSEEEDIFLQDLAGNVDSYWLGGDPNGMEWVWSDGTAMDYTNYYYGDHSPGECLLQEYNLLQYGWSTAYCGFHTNYICKL